MDLQTIGRILLAVGIGLVLLGALFLLLGRIPILNRLGHLPGDIRVQREGFSCFVPLTSMILLSILLTVIANLIVRIINRS